MLAIIPFSFPAFPNKSERKWDRTIRVGIMMVHIGQLSFNEWQHEKKGWKLPYNINLYVYKLQVPSSRHPFMTNVGAQSTCAFWVNKLTSKEWSTVI